MADRKLDGVQRLYAAVKDQLKRNIVSDATGQAIHDFALFSLRFLQSECNPVQLQSLVPGKTYVSFARKDALDSIARPANADLFDLNPNVVSERWEAWWQGKISRSDLAKMSYTVALAPCLVMELFDRQNKKGPATYFECLIGHVFAKSIGVNPRKQAALKVKDRTVRLTMDFLFDMGKGGLHIHLPVKMSTRERVVQAWAHQTILDAVYGVGAYKGVMVLFSETKLDIKKREVIEICVPDQWLAYQTYLARMERIYYFDIPERYAALTNSYPELLPIKHFGDFFAEKAAVLAR